MKTKIREELEKLGEMGLPLEYAKEIVGALFEIKAFQNSKKYINTVGLAKKLNSSITCHGGFIEVLRLLEQEGFITNSKIGYFWYNYQLTEKGMNYISQ